MYKYVTVVAVGKELRATLLEAPKVCAQMPVTVFIQKLANYIYIYIYIYIHMRKIYIYV